MLAESVSKKRIGSSIAQVQHRLKQGAGAFNWDDLQCAIRECYGFDEDAMSTEDLTRLFQELDSKGSGSVSVSALIKLLDGGASHHQIKNGRSVGSPIGNLVSEAQQEEIKSVSSPLLWICVARLRDQLTLASQNSVGNGLIRLELETASKRLMQEIARGNLRGGAPRSIALDACSLAYAMDPRRKFVSFLALGSPTVSEECTARVLQELLEATRACKTAETCGGGGLANELGPVLAAQTQRLGGFSMYVEHLNSAVKPFSALARNAAPKEYSPGYAKRTPPQGRNMQPSKSSPGLNNPPPNNDDPSNMVVPREAQHVLEQDPGISRRQGGEAISTPRPNSRGGNGLDLAPGHEHKFDQASPNSLNVVRRSR